MDTFPIYSNGMGRLIPWRRGDVNFLFWGFQGRKVRRRLTLSLSLDFPLGDSEVTKF